MKPVCSKQKWQSMGFNVLLTRQLVPDKPKLAAGKEITTIQTCWHLVRQTNSWQQQPQDSKHPQIAELSTFNFLLSLQGRPNALNFCKLFRTNRKCVTNSVFKFPTILLFMSMLWAWIKNEKAHLGIKSKVFPVHVIYKYGGRGGLWYTPVAPPLLRLGTGWRFVVKFMPRLLGAQARSSSHRLKRRQRRMQSWCGHFEIEKNLLPLPKFNHYSFFI